MKFIANKLLSIAAGEIGYHEKETNSSLDHKTANAGDEDYTKYARDLHAAGYYQGNKQGYAWCDVFVDWCFLQLCGGDAVKAQEIICQSGLYGAGCKYSAQYYKQAGRFYTADPQPGDQIFFNNYAHTGIVEKVEGSVVHTIEGNTGNQVARRTYTLGSSSIDGYGRPWFDTQEAMTEDSLLAHEREHHKVYETLEDVPGWAKVEISELVEKGLLLGDGNGLNLSHDLLRTLVVLYRALEAAGVL
jgi:hypothetical protein